LREFLVEGVAVEENKHLVSFSQMVKWKDSVLSCVAVRSDAEENSLRTSTVTSKDSLESLLTL
jgi:hypothetical protein